MLIICDFVAFWKYRQQCCDTQSKGKGSGCVQEATNWFTGQVMRNYYKDIQMTFNVCH